MHNSDLKSRTMSFAVGVSRLCSEIEGTWRGRRIADQLFRSGTAVAANYRAARRARSKREFVAKIGTVLEESDETLFWIEFIDAVGLTERAKYVNLHVEADELVAIFTAASKTASENLRLERMAARHKGRDKARRVAK